MAQIAANQFPTVIPCSHHFATALMNLAGPGNSRTYHSELPSCDRTGVNTIEATVYSELPIDFSELIDDALAVLGYTEIDAPDITRANLYREVNNLRTSLERSLSVDIFWRA